MPYKFGGGDQILSPQDALQIWDGPVCRLNLAKTIPICRLPLATFDLAYAVSQYRVKESGLFYIKRYIYIYLYLMHLFI